jgi:hypothetical protein
MTIIQALSLQTEHWYSGNIRSFHSSPPDR